MVKSFQDLKVWQKAHQLTLLVYAKTKEFPLRERFGVTSQLRSSAVSVCANIAEGGKKSRKDFIRFLDIAEGSLEETKYHLLLSKDLEYLSIKDYEDSTALANEVGRMLNGLMGALRRA